MRLVLFGPPGAGKGHTGGAFVGEVFCACFINGGYVPSGSERRDRTRQASQAGYGHGRAYA